MSVMEAIIERCRASQPHIVLSEGDYVIQVRRKDKSEAEATASIKAGQRTEVTVE